MKCFWQKCHEAKIQRPAVPTGGKLPTDHRIKPFEYLLYHVNPIVIPPKTQTTVMLPAPKRLIDFVGPLLVEPAPNRVRCKSHLLTAYGITHVVNGKIAVQVINNSHHSDSLPSLAPIAMVRGETVTVIDQAPDTDPMVPRRCSRPSTFGRPPESASL